MSGARKILFLAILLGLAGFGSCRTAAFALLGPFQPWMQYTNGLRQVGDIGGPMSLGNGYRWNVPVVTYGFDPSFVKFFGTNGVAAIESAIQILNDLPPASQTTLASYPDNSQSYNYTAQAQSLYDLKSTALQLLLEQMGLAQPARYTFVLRQWNPVFLPPTPNQFSTQNEWPDWVYPDYITNLNYDPQTLQASESVNDTLYTAEIFVSGDQNFLGSIPVDPFANTDTAVADVYGLYYGGFYTGLTYDDVGGLDYLLSPTNVNYETLLPGVIGVGTNASSFVDGALRPGVDKITFVPQPVDAQSGAFVSMTNDYTDTYITNGVTVQQQLARVTSRPDFLFCAGNQSDRTGTTNWINNAVLNGNPGGGGPGIIQPPARIVFDKIGLQYSSVGPVSGIQPAFQPQFWGSFGGSTNPPVSYPIPLTGTNEMAVQLTLFFYSGNLQSFEWDRCSLVGTEYAFQTSTDLMNWTTLFVATNNGTVTSYNADKPSGTAQFFRLSP